MSSSKIQIPPGAWLAARFLFPFRNGGNRDAHRTDESAPGPLSSWTRAAVWLPLWGLAIGVGYAVIYRGAWKWFGEYQHLRLLPAAILLIVDFGWLGYRQFAAAVQIVDGRNPDMRPTAGLGLPGTLAVGLIGLLKYAMLVVLPAGVLLWPADWRQHLGPLYPAVIYRPLVLMPLWGRWAMMLALCIGRVAPAGTDRLRHMAAGARLTAIMGWWFSIALLTVAYSSPLPEHIAYGIVVAMAVLMTTYLVTFALARWSGGQTETTVAAAGLAGELAFLSVYLPVARAIYWY